MHGFGRLKNSVGVYEGNFSNDKQEGFGRFTWSSGDIFEGFWHDGKQIKITNSNMPNEIKKNE